METKQCECGKKMILTGKGIVLSSNPPQYPYMWWCGGCGKKEDGPTLVGKTKDELNMDLWKKANE